MMRKNNFKLSSLRGANRGQANFELGKEENRKIPGIFLLCRKIGMTFILWILVSSTSMTKKKKSSLFFAKQKIQGIYRLIPL